MAFLRRSLFFVVLALAGMIFYHFQFRAEMRMALYQPPAEFAHVPLDELLANASRYNGRVVQTEGYIRFFSFLHVRSEPGLFDLEPTGKMYYALSPMPVLKKDPAHSTFGQTGVTNLYVITYEPLLPEIAREGAAQRVVVLGTFTLTGKEKKLRLKAYAPLELESRE